VSLSALVITRNEEANIAECLAGMAWADEVVVVDAASTDRTREIAAGFTPKVFCLEWQGYAEARRCALSKCTCDWVLSVDADERVTEELKREVEEVLRAPAHQGYLIPRRAFFLGRSIRHCGWYPGRVLRLARRDRVSVTDRKVHEGMRVEGSVGTLRSPLLHYTYPTVEAYFARFDTYTTLAAEELHRRGKRVRLFDLTLRPFFQFTKMYFLKMGWLDGLEGFALCVFSGLYVLVKYMKLRQMSRERGSRAR
jgi:glycosyltransferase involved in cell wall biosynthesis